jgi:hypothetical protein
MADLQSAPASASPNGHVGSGELENYSLPTQGLTNELAAADKGRTPLVLCACGSFSPITMRTSGGEEHSKAPRRWKRRVAVANVGGVQYTCECSRWRRTG